MNRHESLHHLSTGTATDPALDFLSNRITVTSAVPQMLVNWQGDSIAAFSLRALGSYCQTHKPIGGWHLSDRNRSILMCLDAQHIKKTNYQTYKSVMFEGGGYVKFNFKVNLHCSVVYLQCYLILEMQCWSFHDVVLL